MWKNSLRRWKQIHAVASGAELACDKPIRKLGRLARGISDEKTRRLQAQILLRTSFTGFQILAVLAL